MLLVLREEVLVQSNSEPKKFKPFHAKRLIECYYSASIAKPKHHPQSILFSFHPIGSNRKCVFTLGDAYKYRKRIKVANYSLQGGMIEEIDSFPSFMFETVPFKQFFIEGCTVEDIEKYFSFPYEENTLSDNEWLDSPVGRQSWNTLNPWVAKVHE